MTGKYPCDMCGNKYRIRGMKIRRGKLLCFKCNIKETHFIGGRNATTIEKAINKTYKVKGYLTKQGKIYASSTFPQILIGHKFKLQLIK